MIALSSFLTSAGNLGDLSRLRDVVLRHMIADLLETGNFRDRGDAIRQLHADGYKTIDIMILVDEAVYLCVQDVVARAISDVDHIASEDASTVIGHPGTVQMVVNNLTGAAADCAGSCPQTLKTP